MAEPTKVYWDACTWISLICAEPGRVERCESLITRARNGDVQIWTSSLTLAEVYKVRARADCPPLPEDRDHAFEAFLEQSFVVEAQVDHDIGVAARKLLRTYGPGLKCNDAVHLATAAFHNLDELHTFDGTGLIRLHGAILRADGRELTIREPPEAMILQQPDMLDELAAANAAGAAAAPGPVDAPHDDQGADPVPPWRPLT